MKSMTTNNTRKQPRRKNVDIREENQTLILQVAERIFATNGFHGASMQEIANVSQLAKSNILYYFKTKENLYRHVLKSMLEDWMLAANNFEYKDDPEVVITQYVRAKMQLARNRPYGSAVWAQEVMSGAPFMDEFFSTILNTWVKQCVAILQRWQNAGSINITDPHAFLYLIWSSTQHYADFSPQLVILNDNQPFTDQEFEEKTQALTRMILNSAGLPTVPINSLLEDSTVTEQKSIRIDGGRLWDSLMEMAKIGATEKGGCCRLALTDLDKEARDLFVSWCKQAGCSIKVDKMGNVFARRAGKNNDLAPVMTGSHIDTQPTGGRFDGVYGVLAGLEVIRSLNDQNIKTERPIEAAIWTNEEGSRFAPAMVASGVFAGVFDLEYGLSRADEDGKTMGEELVRIGYAGEEPVGGRNVHAFFEVHIEQGPILEEDELPIGVVTHGQGQRWYELTLTGVESHAGPTPMDRRKDALLGAARVIELVNRVGLNNAPVACATVGMINSYPNSRNVIPGEVFLTIDIRHPNDDILSKMDEEVRAGIAEITEKTGLQQSLEQIFYYAPVPFDEDCVSAVRKAAQECGYAHRDIVAGAGHDACYMAKVAPTSMVFVPCIDGISHNEIEDAKPEWITAGCNVLINAMVERANQF